MESFRFLFVVNILNLFTDLHHLLSLSSATIAPKNIYGTCQFEDGLVGVYFEFINDVYQYIYTHVFSPFSKRCLFHHYFLYDSSHQLKMNLVSKVKKNRKFQWEF